MTRLLDLYRSDIRPKMAASSQRLQPLAVPKLTKIVINVSLGDLKSNDSLKTSVAETLGKITGQKPLPTRAKTSIAGFKVRRGDLAGYRVTLRGARMYDFLDRLITYVLPRLRDFHGVSRQGFDRQGNFSLGLREYTIFPEVSYETAREAWGLEVTLVTTGQSPAMTAELLEELGLPLAKDSREARI